MSNIPNYLALARAFIAGSSWIVSGPFLKAVAGYEASGIINFPYWRYSLIAPVYFGVWTAIAVSATVYLGWSLTLSLFAVSIVSALTIMTLITYLPLYRVSRERLHLQYWYLAVSHVLTYNLVIRAVLTLTG